MTFLFVWQRFLCSKSRFSADNIDMAKRLFERRLLFHRVKMSLLDIFVSPADWDQTPNTIKVTIRWDWLSIEYWWFSVLRWSGLTNSFFWSGWSGWSSWSSYLHWCHRFHWSSYLDWSYWFSGSLGCSYFTGPTKLTSPSGLTGPCDPNRTRRTTPSKYPPIGIDCPLSIDGFLCYFGLNEPTRYPGLAGPIGSSGSLGCSYFTGLTKLTIPPGLSGPCDPDETRRTTPSKYLKI